MNSIRRHIDELTSAAARVFGRKQSWLRCAAFGLFIAAFCAGFDYESHKRPRLGGDAWEYWCQAESFRRHASPELWPEDVRAVNEEALRLKVGEPYPDPYAYAAALDGRLYGMHFWAYGLSAAPTEEYQHFVGRTPLADLRLANICWYALALGVVLFASKAPIRERVAMACLSGVGPIFWYVEWPGAEVYSWALTTISVVAYRDGRYGFAGMAAGLAAMQNPTIIFIGAVAALEAALERRFRTAAAAACGTSLALVPYAFFFYHFGKPSLIAADISSLKNISWVRTWGLIGDFDQGLLPYLPFVAIGLIVGSIRIALVGNVRGLLLVLGGSAMAIGTQVAHNWNSDCEGLQRYLVWMLPVAAGIAIEGVGGTWRMWSLAILAATSNLAIFFACNEVEEMKGDYLSHSLLTEWVLTHHPRAYWVEPEVFIERQRHADNWPLTPSEFPIAYIRKDGTVSKMVLDPASVEKVAERFDVEPAFMDALRDRANRESGIFFSHPGSDAVRVRH